LDHVAQAAAWLAQTEPASFSAQQQGQRPSAVAPVLHKDLVQELAAEQLEPELKVDPALPVDTTAVCEPPKNFDCCCPVG